MDQICLTVYASVARDYDSVQNNREQECPHAFLSANAL